MTNATEQATSRFSNTPHLSKISSLMVLRILVSYYYFETVELRRTCLIALLLFNSTGDIAVFEHTKHLEKVILSYGSGISGELLRFISLRHKTLGSIPCIISGDVMVFKKTSSIKEIDICSTKCYGKCREYRIRIYVAGLVL